MHPHLGKRGAEGGGGDEASSALGTEDGPSAGQISSCCRIWREGDASAAEGPREFRASTAGGDASPDRPGDAHPRNPAASDASSTSQHEPGQILGSFDRNHRKSVDTGRRTTTRQPGPRNPGVEADPPDLYGYPVPGGWCSLGCRVGRRTGSRVTGPRRGRSRGDMADFEEAHAPGRPPVEATMSRARKAATENTLITTPPKKTRTAAPAAVEQGGADIQERDR